MSLDYSRDGSWLDRDTWGRRVLLAALLFFGGLLGAVVGLMVFIWLVCRGTW